MTITIPIELSTEVIVTASVLFIHTIASVLLIFTKPTKKNLTISGLYMVLTLPALITYWYNAVSINNADSPLSILEAYTLAHAWLFMLAILTSIIAKS